MKKLQFFLVVLFVIISQGCSNDDLTDNASQCLTIYAKEINDNSLISGGIYQILDAQGKTIETVTLDAGTISINEYSAGQYTIKQLMPPSGYIAMHKEKTITLDGNCKNVTFQYINEDTREIPDNITLKFYGTDSNTLYGEYNGIRIGEYYWMDQNFYCQIPWGGDFENSHPITQALLDRYMKRILIDPAEFQLSDISAFEKYYGRHYSYPSILYMNQHGQMRNKDGDVLEGWRLPTQADYRQLFGMCPFNTTHDGPHIELNERDVRFALSVREGENPFAYNIGNHQTGYKTYWFTPGNSNVHNFNLMPGGARLNGDGSWCNGLGPNNGCYDDGKKGDIYHLFYTAVMAVVNPKHELSIEAIILHDYVDTEPLHTYHLMNVRWCRRLTDVELGYRLYINSDQTDIKKLGLESPHPNGYSELPNGYVRGFYVQYILNNPNPKVSVSDIVTYSRLVEDNYVRHNRHNPSIIF